MVIWNIQYNLAVDSIMSLQIIQTFHYHLFNRQILKCKFSFYFALIKYLNKNVELFTCFSFSRERRAMLDMMNELRLGFRSLQQELEDERRARRNLESQIQRLLVVTTGK